MKRKSLIVLGLVAIMSLSLPLLSYASTFSEFWYQDTQGNWHIQDNNGNMVTNAWLCDDAVPSNGQNIWYLIDSNGNMVSAGLVQDQTGNIYSLETSHNGYYGMLRYQSGKENTVFRGTFEDVKNYLSDALEDYPQIEKLIVPADKLAAFSVKVKTPGNIAHKHYGDIVSAMRGNKEV